MRLYLFFIVISIVSGCTSIEVAKELTKASKSIKTTIIKSTQDKQDKDEMSNNDEKKDLNNQNKKNDLENEKKNIAQQKKKEKTLAKKQQEIVVINFLGKTLKEIIEEIGNPFLIRKDGNTNTARFDRESCRIFIFFNSLQNLPRVEYFEIRDDKGNLLDQKEHIDRCYKKFKLV